MKRAYQMLDLDCTHCAARMEVAIAKIDGVQSVRVSFLAQKLTIEADEDRFDVIMEEAVKCVKNVDAGCEIVF